MTASIAGAVAKASAMTKAAQSAHILLSLVNRLCIGSSFGDELPFSVLARSPWGGYALVMSEPHAHASHPAIATRLKRAEGHLRRVIGMIEEARPCIELATQLHAVERAVAEAKRALIHEHIDQCMTTGGENDLVEIKSLTKLL